MKVYRVAEFGRMIVYERDREGEQIPKYFVFNQFTGKVLEEFRRKVSAVKFARENQNG
jgi:hypothetical protein